MNPERSQRVRVDRAFFMDNKIVGVGSVLDVPLSFAVECRTARKVTFVQADTPLTLNRETAPVPDGRLPPEQQNSGEAKPAAAKSTSKVAKE